MLPLDRVVVSPITPTPSYGLQLTCMMCGAPFRPRRMGWLWRWVRRLWRINPPHTPMHN
jgi:hypothetical protein